MPTSISPITAAAAELLVYRVPIMQHQNMFLSEHREYGGSIYDTHTDGSGLCLSSRLRPILSIRPKYDHFLMQAPWQYPADLHLIYWLETMGYKYDVITDEDVNYDGLARLKGYNVVITGSHPEHNSGPQLDALHDYTQQGGRLMYMGADGWYWVHSYHPAYEHLGRGVVTEMRRCESGIRTWRADPGEYYHQGTGELGGMWRYRGRYLHSVAGTGMSSEGFDISSYYSRTPESNDPRVSWAFEGIELRREAWQLRARRRRSGRHRARHRRYAARIAPAHPHRRDLGRPPHRGLSPGDGRLWLQPTGHRRHATPARSFGHSLSRDAERRSLLCFQFDRVLRLASVERRKEQYFETGRKCAQSFHEGWAVTAGSSSAAIVHRGRADYDPPMNKIGRSS